MGGKTKKPISAMEKQQKLRELKEKKVKEKKEKEEKKEKKISSPLIPLEVVKQLENELNNIKCITPFVLASKFGLKMGVAKRVLRELENRGILNCVIRGSRISVYTPVNYSPAK
ncbi:MAG: 30S ribosomal protein S25e [Candidatus Nezhaarchaeota archaeon]|nr:30S ribosomal protein S25e [Candidatus Nezhaarchaeota archaeon]